MTTPMHILSLGAGVQSSTMALMAARGEIMPMPVAAIFADTGDEPKAVMDWLDQLEKLLPFPVYRVQSHHGKLSDNLLKGEFSQIPAYMPGTIGKRQCTNHWKLRPIKRKIRELSKGNPVVQWIGISVDEVSRAKDSGVQYITNRHPLLEIGVTRRECVAWLTKRGFNGIPKSACVYCPYHSDRQWEELRTGGGDEWALVVKIDTLLRSRGEYLHPTCEPIESVRLTDSDRGQGNLFNNECTGMCGV